MAFHILQASGLTQQEFADRVGVTQPALSYYLKGRTPSTEVLLKISAAFKILVQDILAINEASSIRDAAVLFLVARAKNLMTEQIRALGQLM